MRKPVISMFVAVAVLTTGTVLAQPAQKYPVKPVRLLAGAFGSPSDMLARTIGTKLSEVWKQPVVVENRTGGAGTLAAAILAKATPDGYTLLLISAQFPIGAALQPNLPYDPHKDFVGVTQIVQGFGRDGSHALYAPAATPMAIRNQISRDVARVLDQVDVKERLHAQAYHLAPTTPVELDKILREQIQSFGEMAKRLGLKT